MISFAVVGNAHAEGYTGADFLKFSNEQKKYWIASTIDTLGFVAGYKDKKIAQCVWEWYYAEEDLSAKYGLIEAYMKKHSTKSPSHILLAMTEHACGKYVRK